MSSQHQHQPSDESQPLPSNPFPPTQPPYLAYNIVLELEGCPQSLITAISASDLDLSRNGTNDVGNLCYTLKILARLLGYCLIEFRPEGQLEAASEIIECPNHLERLKLSNRYIDYLISPCTFSYIDKLSLSDTYTVI